MIVAVLTSPDRAGYLAADLEAERPHSFTVLIAKDRSCVDAVHTSGVVEAMVVEHDRWRRSLVPALLGRVAAQVPENRFGPRIRRFANSLEWRLRYVDRIGRSVRHVQRRWHGRGFEQRLADLIADVCQDYSVAELWLYDAWNADAIEVACGKYPVRIRIR